MDFSKFQASNIFKINLTYVNMDNDINTAEVYVEANSKEEVEHFVVNDIPRDWKQVLSHSVTRLSIMKITPDTLENDSLFFVTCTTTSPTHPGEIGELYLVDSNTIYIDCDGDIYGNLYDLNMKCLGNVLLTRFATNVDKDDSDRLMEKRKLINVYCHSGASYDGFGTFGNNYYLDINSLTISEGEAYANLYKYPHTPAKMARVHCRRFQSV